MTTNACFTRRVSRVFWAGLLAVMVGACGDQNLFDSMSEDDTTTAAVESAKIAIDNGDFDAAIATLQSLCGTNSFAPTCDGETASLLASAFAGRAGVNVFDLIENSAGALSGSTLSSLSTFSTLFSFPSTRDKSDLHLAVAYLDGLPNPTANQNLQMAIYAMADAVVTVGVDLTAGFSSISGLPNVRPLETTIQNAENTNGTLTDVANALDLALEGLSDPELGLENEALKNDIEALEASIDTDVDGSQGYVSAAEMQSFLATL